MLEIKNVSKSFSKKVVIKNLNLKLEKASIFGLVGINGAGKSTLLRLIAGSLIVDNGSITYNDEIIIDNEKVKKDIFFLPDDPHYNANTTGNSLISLYKVFYNLNFEVFKKLTDEFKIELDKPIHAFSKGMRRQLYVAIAIAISPKLLILDEAFDGLDPKSRLVFKRALINLVEENETTIIISSHSLRELEDICDTFGLLDGGNFKTSGLISENLEDVNKYQLAFSEAKTATDFKHLNPLNVEIMGKVVQLIIRGNLDEIKQQLELLKPLFVEVISIDFEELFIYEVGEHYEALS